MSASITSNKHLPFIAFRRTSHLAKVRLFCLPHAGGSALSFRSLAGSLPADIDVCPIEIPGRGTRFHESLSVQLTYLVDEIAFGISTLIDYPFAIYGHSLGALLGFELCKVLVRDYQARPQYLFVSGMRAPYLPSRHSPMHLLPNDDLVAKLKQLGGIPASIFECPDLTERMLKIIRADLEMCETYQYQESMSLDVPIHAFGGKQDLLANCEEIRAWQTHTSGVFKLTIYSGGHFFVENMIKSISQEISQDLGW